MRARMSNCSNVTNATLVVALCSVLAAAWWLPSGTAQEASPAAGSLLAAGGYPELRITATDTGIDLPTTVGAGRYLVIVENSGGQEADVEFIQPPAGMTIADLRAMEATPQAEESGPNAIYYDLTLGGGVAAPAGAEGRVVLDLSAGEWLVTLFVGEDVDVEPRILTVTADDRSTATSPPKFPGAVAVEMRDLTFVMPDELTAGPQVWNVANTGDQPYYLQLTRAPGPIGVDDVMTLVSLDEDAIPPPGLPGPEAFEEVAETTALSAGRSVAIEIDLEPGTYVALCFIPDRETGVPHAAMGMIKIISVGAATATPAP